MTLRGTGAPLAALLLCGCFTDGPVGMWPGGAFDSTSAPCPQTGGWARFADEAESELEVRPSSPRSVRTWNVVHDGDLYVPADFLLPFKRWPYQVLDDPRVRIRIGGETFDCLASRISDPALTESVREATGRKYDIDPDSRAARVDVWWFAIRPRD